MVRDLKRISLVAIVLLVLVRISIGWQFLYEGLWKLQTLKTPAPWTAEGYLKAAQGPLREHFRGLVGDPDDLEWLDYPTMEQRWNDWREQFVRHYDLTEEQKQRLDRMVDGYEEFTAELEELPEAVRPHVQPDGRFKGSLAETIRYDADRKLLVVSGKQHLSAEEQKSLKDRVKVVKEPAPENERQNELASAFQKAVDKLYKESTQYATHDKPGLAFKERLRATLQGDPEMFGEVYGTVAADPDLEKGQPDETKPKDPKAEEQAREQQLVRTGKIAFYKEQVRKYNEALAGAATDYQHRHLDWLRSQGALPQYTIQQLKAEVVGPIRAMDADLKSEAQLLLNEEQRALGPVPLPWTRIQTIDFLTMWSLTVIGVLLIAGLFTPFAALAGAGLLASFYLVIPPWSGVPEAPGPEHAWIVNKNFIEALVLLAVTALPTGRWFGVDAIFHWMWVKLSGRGRQARELDPKRVESMTRPADRHKAVPTGAK